MIRLLAALVLLAAVAGFAAKQADFLSAPDEIAPTPDGAANTFIDYSTATHTLSPRAFGMDESHYGEGSGLTTDLRQQTQLRKLGIGALRLDLAYKTAGDPASRIVCYAAGCDQSIAGIDWVEAARATGAEPVIKVRMSARMPRRYWATDAANEVAHFNTSPGSIPVTRWIIGNEPDLGGIDADEYAEGFIEMYRAMKAVDPAIEIGGPAVSSYKRDYIETVLRILNENGVVPDFVDWHQYGRGGDVEKSDAVMLSSAIQSYERNANDLRALLADVFGEARAADIDIEVGEWGLSWTGDARQLTQFGTVWTAAAIGHMVNAGVSSRFYATKNGPLGALCDRPELVQGGVRRSCLVNDPLPAYHGIGMFTGESLFRGFGSKLVEATTRLEDVAVYASDDPRNIVAINKHENAVRFAVFSLGEAVATSVTVWQMSGDDASPVDLGEISVVDGKFSYALKPWSVYTFLVNP